MVPRNIGIVGNRKAIMQHRDQPSSDNEDDTISKKRNDMDGRIEELLRRECSPYGGAEVSARAWIEKARALQKGSGGGRGKVNLKGRPVDADTSAEKEVNIAAAAHED